MSQMKPGPKNARSRLRERNRTYIARGDGSPMNGSWFCELKRAFSYGQHLAAALENFLLLFNKVKG